MKRILVYGMLLMMAGVVQAGEKDPTHIRKTRLDQGMAGNINFAVSGPKGDFLAYRSAVIAQKVRDRFLPTTSNGEQHICLQITYTSFPERVEVDARPQGDTCYQCRSHTLHITIMRGQEKMLPEMIEAGLKACYTAFPARETLPEPKPSNEYDA